MAVVGDIRTAARGWEVWDGSKWVYAEDYREACQLQLTVIPDDGIFAPHEIEILSRHMERRRKAREGVQTLGDMLREHMEAGS